MRNLIRGLREFQSSYFVSNRDLFEQLAQGQHPSVLFITCSDSRIVPSLIVDADPGELFVIRNAGNIIPAYGAANGGEGAAIEYAIHALNIEQVIICGHNHCGAMKGLLKLNKLQEDMPLVYDWLKHTDATPPATPPATEQKPYTNHISQRYRAAIGPMMGKVSPHNPIGISRNLVKKVYALQRSEGASTDSWLTGSIAHASGSSGVTNYPRLLMLFKTTSSSSSATATVHTPPEDIADSSDNESVNYESVQFTPPPPDRPRPSFIMRSPIINVGILVESNINVLNPTVFSDRLDWTLHVSRSAERSDKPTAVPIVAIFNWHYRGPSRQMSHARSDIATGDSALMHCLYQIGQTNFDARVTIPTYRGYWEPNQFMTFSPSGPPYIPDDYPGSYISRTPQLGAFADYICAIDDMNSNYLNSDIIQILYLSVVFDFMAFTAQTFRRVLKRKPSTPANLKAIRDIMVENISTMKARHDSDNFSVMAHILKAVVLHS